MLTWNFFCQAISCILVFVIVQPLSFFYATGRGSVLTLYNVIYAYIACIVPCHTNLNLKICIYDIDIVMHCELITTEDKII